MHVRSALRTLVTAGAVAALALPGAAYAETFKHADPAQDVQAVDESSATDRPDNKTADVTRLTVRHTADQLTATVRLRALAKKWTVVSELTTPDRSFVVLGSRTASGTGFGLSKPSGKPVSCDGITGSQSRSDHTISFVVPASCLGSPRWVKAGVGVVVGRATVYADDALRDGGADEDHLTLSRKIHRG